MKINRLRLKNFRSYEDEIEFDFTTTDDKNIILIGGENGAGKSSIFESIKLCIYGPLAYKYQGYNSSYIHRIKSNINDNAIKDDNVDAYVSIDIELIEGGEKNIYTLIRQWSFADKKLEESFWVYKNYSEEALNDEELDYFQSYIKSVISPKIFDFFFFDGEQLSNFFIGRYSHKHLKQSLLTLCNYDTFDVLKSTIIFNSRKVNDADNEEIKEAGKRYRELEMKLNELNERYEFLLDRIQKIQLDLEEAAMERDNLEASFRKQGGLLAEEIDGLNEEIRALESRRGEINSTIKNFCNDILPFLIVKDKLKVLKKQLINENKYLTYYQLKDKINPEYIFAIIKDKVDNGAKEVAVSISKALTEDIKPEIDDKEFRLIHGFSQEENNAVISTIDKVLVYDYNEIFSLYDEIRKINHRIKEIREILRSSLDNEEISKFVNKIAEKTNYIARLNEEKNRCEMEIEELEEEINSVTNEVEKAKEGYYDLLKSNNIIDISASIIEVLDEVIASLTREKIEKVKENFMEIFNKIIKKDGFIDYIDIDQDFNVTLYVDKLYNSMDIINMIDNIGYEEMEKKLGNGFFEDLYKEFNVNDRSELDEALKKDANCRVVNLRTKIDVNSLSSGEKQIYILCLYWALIKASGVELPFIIDTPYARIDEAHRQNITLNYFTSISNQVIILSTNTEINEDLYKAMKNRINREYLLVYDDRKRKTRIYNRYFFEV